MISTCPVRRVPEEMSPADGLVPVKTVLGCVLSIVSDLLVQDVFVARSIAVPE